MRTDEEKRRLFLLWPDRRGEHVCLGPGWGVTIKRAKRVLDAHAILTICRAFLEGKQGRNGRVRTICRCPKDVRYVGPCALIPLLKRAYERGYDGLRFGFQH